MAKKIKNWGGARESAFSDKTVAKIRKLAAEGKTVAEISVEVGARYDTTTRVVKGYSYRHLPPVESYKAQAKPESTNVRTYQAAAIAGFTASTLAVSTLSLQVKAGDTLADCDPRRVRTGVVIRVNTIATIPSAAVKWNSGKETLIPLSKIHRKPDAKKGFRLLDDGVSTASADTSQRAAVA
jgi:hypothetical protein